MINSIKVMNLIDYLTLENLSRVMNEFYLCDECMLCYHQYKHFILVMKFCKVICFILVMTLILNLIKRLSFPMANLFPQFDEFHHINQLQQCNIVIKVRNFNIVMNLTYKRFHQNKKKKLI